MQLFALLIFSGLFFEQIPGSKYFWAPIDYMGETFEDRSLTGEWFISGERLHEWDSGPSFNGDGYNVRVSQLKSKSSKYFQSPDSLFFSEFPKNKHSDWEIKEWTTTPCKEKDLPAYYFANHSFRDSDFKLDELMEEEGNYYSYECKKQGDIRDIAGEYIANIHFYIISPNRQLIIKISFFT